MIPRELLLLSKNRLQILFNALMAGDGCRHCNGQLRYYTSSKKLSDQVQDLALKLGYSTRIAIRKRKIKFIKGVPVKRSLPAIELTFTTEKRYWVDIKNIKKVQYNGKVYCCSTNNGIVYVRRNGCSLWCGNSIPTHADIIHFMTKDIGYLPMTTIIWDKRNVTSRTAWGSFRSPVEPSFPKPFEYILVFAKETYRLQDKGVTDLTNEEFIEWSSSLWTFPAETRISKKTHPAPFPEELPRRCIKMLSWKGAVVLDPFLGSGTTARVCKKLERNFIGIELSPEYCKLATKRTSNVILEDTLFDNNEESDGNTN
jgi:DNA modification methylase